MNLFQEGTFTGHSGDELHWKIECDALSDNDWKCLARMIHEHEPRPFQSAIGIPRGGMVLGSYLNEYGTGDPKDPYLICDDVLTTGGSMIEFRDKYFSKHDTIGWVIWNRGTDDPAILTWVKGLFSMPYYSKEFGNVHMIGMSDGTGGHSEGFYDYKKNKYVTEDEKFKKPKDPTT